MRPLFLLRTLAVQGGFALAVCSLLRRSRSGCSFGESRISNHRYISCCAIDSLLKPELPPATVTTACCGGPARR